MAAAVPRGGRTFGSWWRRLPEALRDGHRLETTGHNSLHHPADPDDWIPAGEYRLYVFTEGEDPVEVELRLGGLSGYVDLATTRDAMVEIVRLGARYPTPEETLHFQGGHQTQVGPNNGRVVASIGLKGTHPHLARFNLRQYFGGTTSEASYLAPVCLPRDLGGPGGYGGVPAGGFVSVEEGETFVRATTIGYALDGPESALVASATALGGTSLLALGAWISFD